MTRAASPPSRSQLLHYLAAHRVLICKECRYAIQPSAISRHLKELHHIYRSDRQELMQYVQTLDLADPGDIVLSEPQKTPVPFLPTNSGLACGFDGCTHLCISVKRMKNHCATVHSGVVTDEATWRSVYLQTFFRGNQLRYFEVYMSSTPASDSGRSSEPDKEASPIETPKQADPFYDTSWSTQDIELLENFKNFTALDICQNLGERQLWQTTIPQLARHHSFLKHGILACSALHLGYLHPSERTRYQLTAACHQYKALPEFRTAIASPTEENCNALIAFSQLLIIHCFAAEEQDENLLLVTEKHKSGIPDWLQIIRGSCTIFVSTWKFLKTSPVVPIIEERKISERLLPTPEISEGSRRLEYLLKLPFFRSSSIAGNLAQGHVSPFPAALLELSLAFSKAQAARDSGIYNLSTVLHIWPAKVSQDYLDCLKERDPAALVLLAHYCLLLKPLESNWYMRGFGKRLLTKIYKQLDDEWRQWLQWPLEEIGLQE